MSLTGSVIVDLTSVPRDRMRHRVAALADAPAGVRAVVVVGALLVEPDAVRILREHVDRLHVDVRGESHAVNQWLDALRNGFLGDAA